jgi:hypothetical protein
MAGCGDCQVLSQRDATSKVWEDAKRTIVEEAWKCAIVGKAEAAGTRSCSWRWFRGGSDRLRNVFWETAEMRRGGVATTGEGRWQSAGGDSGGVFQFVLEEGAVQKMQLRAAVVRNRRGCS